MNLSPRSIACKKHGNSRMTKGINGIIKKDKIKSSIIQGERYKNIDPMHNKEVHHKACKKRPIIKKRHNFP